MDWEKRMKLRETNQEPPLAHRYDGEWQEGQGVKTVEKKLQI